MSNKETRGKVVIFVAVFISALVWKSYERYHKPAFVLREGGLTSIKPSDDLATRMCKFADQAVVDAWQYKKIPLDYSPESVEKVEEILAIRKKWMAQKNFSDKDIRAEALILGAYVGEVIRREYRETWSEDDKIAGPGSYPLN